MSIITERNNNPNSIKTIGSVTISPSSAVVVGSFSTWHLTFTVGAYAMDVGGGLKIGTRRQADFGTPQFDNPKDDDFVSVSCSREEARFETYFDTRGHKRPFNAIIAIRLLTAPLYPGDTITIILGDTSGGSRGLTVQSFPETASDFAVFIDPVSSGEYKRVYCQSPNFSVVTGASEFLTLVTPSIVQTGLPFRVQVRGNDKFGNPTPIDMTQLVIDSDPSISFSLSKNNGRATWIDNVKLDRQGIRRLSLCLGTKTLATSNPIIILDQIEEIICWGDTQAQTASTVGVGTPDEYFAYARDSAAIDFTTHQGNDFILSDDDLEEVRQAVLKYNEPGRFAAFFGWEWSGPTGTGGDRNVMFLDDEGPIFRSSHWQLQPEEIANPKTAEQTEAVHASDLQKKIRKYIKDTGKDVIMIPHIGGRRSDFAAQDPELEPVFEICSNHGIFEWRLHEFLAAGIKVGVVAASDDHTCRPGLAYPSTPEMTVLGGLGAVLTKEHSRRGIYDGLMARHCYGTTGARIILSLTANNYCMGDIATTKGPITISGSTHCTAPIENITLFNGSKELQKFQPNPQIKNSECIRILWSGATHQDRGRFMSWDGGLTITGGQILNAVSLNMFTTKHGIYQWGEDEVKWHSITSGQEEGLLLTVNAPNDAILIFKAGPADLKFTIGEVREKNLSWKLKGLDQLIVASTKHTEGNILDTTFEYVEENPSLGEQAYWVRIVQTDFHRAWSSPIFLKIE